MFENIVLGPQNIGNVENEANRSLGDVYDSHVALHLTCGLQSHESWLPSQQRR